MAFLDLGFPSQSCEEQVSPGAWAVPSWTRSGLATPVGPGQRILLRPDAPEEVAPGMGLTRAPLLTLIPLRTRWPGSVSRLVPHKLPRGSRLDPDSPGRVTRVLSPAFRSCDFELDAATS